jgi:hypothetical protein
MYLQRGAPFYILFLPVFFSVFMYLLLSRVLREKVLVLGGLSLQPSDERGERAAPGSLWDPRVGLRRTVEGLEGLAGEGARRLVGPRVRGEPLVRQGGGRPFAAHLGPITSRVEVLRGVAFIGGWVL